MAIPVGKLAAADAGNGIVWKPAFQADNISRHLLQCCCARASPGDLVQLVDGGPAQVENWSRTHWWTRCPLTGPDRRAGSGGHLPVGGQTIAGGARWQ